MLKEVTPEEDDRSDVEKAFDNYNVIAQTVGLPKARFLTKTRAGKIRLRLKDIGGLEVWNEALGKLETTPWMAGDNDRGWRASLDFMLQEASLLKLLEGVYDHD